MVQPPVGLIDINAYIAEVEAEFVPYTKQEGEKGVTIKREIKLREAKAVTGPARETKSQLVPRPIDVEEIALNMALRYEEEDGRSPEDRHNQKGIGYDIYSEEIGKGRRYIEVKGFRGDGATIRMPAHEWEKAEEQRDKYYLYIFAGLEEGGTPRLHIVQDPVKYLAPDAPIDKKISNWENGVIKVIQYWKV